MKKVNPGDPITADWANNLFDPSANSLPGEGMVDEDGFHPCVPLGAEESLSLYRVTSMPRWEDIDPIDGEEGALEAYIHGRLVEGDENAGTEFEFTGNDPDTTDPRIYIPQAYRHNNHSSIELGSIHPGLRVHCSNRAGRLELISSGVKNSWVHTYASTVTPGDIPPFGVCVGLCSHSADDDLSGLARFSVAQLDAKYGDVAGWGYERSFALPYIVNGPWTLDKINMDGIGSLACNEPTWCLYDETDASKPDSVSEVTWGLRPGTYKLHRGLPGFCPVASNNSANRIVFANGDEATLFMRDTRNKNCIATVSDSWYYPIGSDYPGYMVPATVGFTTPLLDILVTLPMPTGLGYNARNSFKNPNLVVGDLILYRTGGISAPDNARAIAVGDCMDDPIGTVKMWLGAYMPRGWRTYTASSGKFVKGGSGSGSFGTTGTDYTYASVPFIERYQ